MKVVLFGNNLVGWRVLEWLREQDEIVALVVHPEENSSFRTEIIEASGLNADRIYTGPMLRDPEVRRGLAALKPDIGVSSYFGYILRSDLLNLFSKGCINVHPALLPYNRGANPNVWSIVEGTPAGATVHYMDEGVDTGDILAQQEVTIEPFDTGETLYRRLEIACIELFKKSWVDFKTGRLKGVKQTCEEGTTHKRKELNKLDCLDLESTYQVKELLNILRARTFPPHHGAYFMHEGKKVYLSLELTPEPDDHD